MPLTYDSAVPYDSPLYTYDGDLVAAAEALGIQDALYRELAFGPALSGIVPWQRVKLDARPDASSAGLYPWVVFRRVNSSEDNLVRNARERWEVEVIGKLTDPDAGDELLQAAADALRDRFAGRHRTWGQYTAEGEAAPGTGLKMRCTHVNTIELIDDELGEKAHLLILVFRYVRGTL